MTAAKPSRYGTFPLSTGCIYLMTRNMKGTETTVLNNVLLV